MASVPPPPPGPRRRLSTSERRAAILDAALECFSSAPYAEVSAAQVAEAADSSTALVFHYFGSKAQLYAEVVRVQAQALADRQTSAQRALPDGVPVRDRVRAMVMVRLDHVAAQVATRGRPPVGGEEPVEARIARQEVREAQVEALRELLPPSDRARHLYAVQGWLGFVDEVCLRWAEAGCPADDRHVVADAALGALEGALGDWRA